MTEREQLIEMRKQIILSKMEGKSETERARVVRDIARMVFTDHADFMSYVDEKVGSVVEVKPKEATDEELDAIVSYLLPGYTPKSGEASQSEMDEIFKHLNI